MPDVIFPLDSTKTFTQQQLTGHNRWHPDIPPVATVKPGESFRVEYGTVEKDFIAMFVDCREGFYQNIPGANVIRGTGPAERYAWASIIRADGSVDDQALEIP